MRILLFGDGRMGQATLSLAVAAGHQVTPIGIGQFPPEVEADQYDGIIDFSHHSWTPLVLRIAHAFRLPLVLAVTGHSQEQVAMIEQAAQGIPLLFTPNLSHGFQILRKILVEFGKDLGDEIQIIETHHRHKADSPSGSAKLLGELVDSPIVSLRHGEVIGEHQVDCYFPGETLSFRHSASSRQIFANGAILGLKFLQSKGPGLYREWENE